MRTKKKLLSLLIILLPLFGCNKGSEKSWFDKGEKFFKENQFEKALQCYDKAIAIKPDFYQALDGRGLSLHILGENDEALLCFDKVLVVDIIILLK